MFDSRQLERSTFLYFHVARGFADPPIPRKLVSPMLTSPIDVLATLGALAAFNRALAIPLDASASRDIRFVLFAGDFGPESSATRRGACEVLRLNGALDELSARLFGESWGIRLERRRALPAVPTPTFERRRL